MNTSWDQNPGQSAPRKSRKKMFILIGIAVLIPIILTVGIIIAVFGAIFFGTKSVEEYKCALAEVRKNDKAVEILGEPMEEGLFMVPNIEINGPRRYVNFSTSMTGPKNSGTLYVSSERNAFRSNFMMALEAEGEKTVLYTGSYPCK